MNKLKCCSNCKHMEHDFGDLLCLDQSHIQDVRGFDGDYTSTYTSPDYKCDYWEAEE